MVKTKNRLGNNIKCLRTAYNETQLDLSLAIGLDSPNSISNYEKGERYPNPDVRKKIAAHYRITEDQLINSDFSSLKFSPLQLGNKEKMIEIALRAFPIITTERAMNDSLFQKGYAAHMRIIDTMKEGCVFSESDFDMCIDSYLDSYNKSKTTESIANIIWWFLIYEIFVKNQWIIENVNDWNDKNILKDDFLKKYYLKDCSIVDEQNTTKDINSNDLEEDDLIIELLSELKKDSKYSDLADYYVALRYIWGCIDNELTEEMNKTVGEEMMWSFMQLGNKYAERIILQGFENKT